MACLGYFSKGKNELRAARTHGAHDRLGVRWTGPVMNGESSPAQALRTVDAAVRLAPKHQLAEREGRFGERMEVDPVLQSHSKKF